MSTQQVGSARRGEVRRQTDCDQSDAHALAEADLRDGLADITVPVLLLYSDADQCAPRPVAEALHHEIPGSELAILRGVGHESYLEAAFNNEIRHFLRRFS